MKFGGSINWLLKQQYNEMSPARKFQCGYCSSTISSEKGLRLGVYADGSGLIEGKGIYICPNCKGPTFFDLNDVQHPGPLIGAELEHIPEDIKAIYEEARRCISVNANTGAVLLCRKLLMNIAVTLGADIDKSFAYYVQFMFDEGHITKKSLDWVDHIRKQGNSATHEIVIMTNEEAQLTLLFTEMILKNNFEYPASLPGKS